MTTIKLVIKKGCQQFTFKVHRLDFDAAFTDGVLTLGIVPQDRVPDETPGGSVIEELFNGKDDVAIESINITYERNGDE